MCCEQWGGEAPGTACEQQRISLFYGSFTVLLRLGAVVMILLGPGECCSVICRNILRWAFGLLGSSSSFQV